MSSFGVVLDACVLIPAALRDTLLRAADAGLYRLHWSERILDEVRRNLIANIGLSEEQAQRLINTMNSYFPESAATGYEGLIEVMGNDPKDRHVLAAAVASGSQVVVTNNLRHFPTEALAPYSIEAQSPDAFLTHLFDLDPALMIHILHDQVGALRFPAHDMNHVLTIHSNYAPTFVGRVRRALGGEAR